jgi:hypothetical protein
LQQEFGSTKPFNKPYNQHMTKDLSSRWKLLLVMMLASVSAVNAQFVVGAKLGANMNQFTQPGTTVGLNAGVYGAYTVVPALTIRFEPHYSQEGGARPNYSRDYSQISDNIASVHFVNPSVRFHNVQIPLFLELTLPEFSEETIKPKLMLGGSYGIMINATEVHTKRYEFIDDGGDTSSPPVDDPVAIDVAYQKENVTDNYARNQWSVWAGIGLEFEAGERSFSFDVRYRQGLNNLNLLRYSSPGNSSGTLGVPGTGGELFSSSLSFNLSMSLFNF